MACPETSDRTKKWFCPAWQPSIWTNHQGDQKVINCVFEGLNLAVAETVRAANAASVEVNCTRNEIINGFAGLAALASLRMQNSKALPGE
jgi:hypothetical protein